ncbi:5-methylcytosine restriction system specificity protein McrC [Candidatus Avelusimicrobium fimicolum]|uniref:5-methylcytosine restriction system specificity protein McrC n=1 Tax=Candidatus Avelusimicrobium fimicolum TaxID=3416216 RepID=UPI003D09F825
MTHYFCDNDQKKLPEQFPTDLEKLAGKTLTDLKEECGNLLVCSGETEDKIENTPLFSISNFGSEKKLHTNNLMGFIGSSQGQMVITSRFCPQTGEAPAPERDFFLYYLLGKVLHFNWVAPYKFPVGETAWIQLLPLLFAHYLNRACAQGLYKQYISTEHNDPKLKGRVDVARHLKHNVPFQGKFCYTQREYSFDNPLTQLIRHTIEYIHTTSWGNVLLSNTPQTLQNVQTIMQATPSYAFSNRGEIIRENLRPIRTAYFSQYIPLQRLCLRILRGQSISYGQNDEKIYGILFDGAWLWETYLYLILGKMGFSHPDNKKKEGWRYLFKEGRHKRYADFYKGNDMILDAKYKHLEKKNEDGLREDLHQLITYMHIFPAPRGVLAYPIKEGTPVDAVDIGTVSGLGGEIALLHLIVPSVKEDYSSFITAMQQNEEKFKQAVNAFLDKKVGFNKIYC